MINDEVTLTLNNPITEEQWDTITDVDFDHTDSIWFRTKNGKEVKFIKESSIKPKTAEWVDDGFDGIGVTGIEYRFKKCNHCGYRYSKAPFQVFHKFCPGCGYHMRLAK